MLSDELDRKKKVKILGNAQLMCHDRKQISNCLRRMGEQKGVGRRDWQGSRRTFGDDDMFIILIVAIVSLMYTCVKTY